MKFRKGDIVLVPHVELWGKVIETFKDYCVIEQFNNEGDYLGLVRRPNFQLTFADGFFVRMFKRMI